MSEEQLPSAIELVQEAAGRVCGENAGRAVWVEGKP